MPRNFNMIVVGALLVTTAASSPESPPKVVYVAPSGEVAIDTAETELALSDGINSCTVDIRSTIMTKFGRTGIRTLAKNAGPNSERMCNPGQHVVNPNLSFIAQRLENAALNYAKIVTSASSAILDRQPVPVTLTFNTSRTIKATKIGGIDPTNKGGVTFLDGHNAANPF